MVGTDLINLVLGDQAKGAPFAVAPVGPTNPNKSDLFVAEGAHTRPQVACSPPSSPPKRASPPWSTLTLGDPYQHGRHGRRNQPRHRRPVCRRRRWFGEPTSSSTSTSGLLPEVERPWAPTSTDGPDRRTAARRAAEDFIPSPLETSAMQSGTPLSTGGRLLIGTRPPTGARPQQPASARSQLHEIRTGETVS